MNIRQVNRLFVPSRGLIYLDKCDRISVSVAPEPVTRGYGDQYLVASWLLRLIFCLGTLTEAVFGRNRPSLRILFLIAIKEWLKELVNDYSFSSVEVRGRVVSIKGSIVCSRVRRYPRKR